MSSTRHAEKDRPLRQERFASSAAFERGLLGNLVARRCELLTDPADRDLVWWLQLVSWQEGGLAKLAADLIAAYPQRLATPSMQKYGFKPGQIYDAEKVKNVRKELAFDFYQRDQFPLRGEKPAKYSWLDWNEGSAYVGTDCSEKDLSEAKAQSQKWPISYPASEFVQLCRDEAESNLAGLLETLCLDPETKLAKIAPWYFPALLETLREYQAAGIAAKRARQVVTELGAMAYDTLDFCLDANCMVLIDGLARTGKTFSVKAWCDLHPGRARYVQVPSSNDDKGFFKAIAKSLGVSINLNSKAHDLRDRIEDVLQRGSIMIVLDEGHYLWPQSNYRDALPKRVNWIMTALKNHGVPVAIVTTPQFMRTQDAVERKSSWTSEQFTGRIGKYQKLPDILSEADLAAVARAFLPAACDKSITTLALYAKNSVKYLAAIECAVDYATFLARKAGRSSVTFDDVRRAIKDNVIPSDKNLAAALAEPKRSGRSRALPTPLQPARTPLASPLESAPRAAAPASARADNLSATNPPGAHRDRTDLIAA